MLSSDDSDAEDCKGLSMPDRASFEAVPSQRVRLLSSNWNAPEPVLRVGGRTVFTRGRPPWYTREGQIDECFVVGICGGSGSGKTTVAQRIIERLNVSWVSILSMDSYYKVLSAEEKQLAKEGRYDFDHPSAIDIKLLTNHLSRLKEGKSIQVPEYDFSTHSRVAKTRTLYGANVVIFEGIMAFCFPELTKLMDLKIFVDTDSDERLSRRLLRDLCCRGRQIPDILHQYDTTVKPAYDTYIAPTMSMADIIIPGGGENAVAIDLIVRVVEKHLKEHSHRLRSEQASGLRQSFSQLRLNGSTAAAEAASGQKGLNGTGSEKSVSSPDTPTKGAAFPWGDGTINGLLEAPLDPAIIPPRVNVLPLTPEARCLHTLLRDRNTNQDAFIFYAERLMRPICEFACRLLPYEDVVVDTPQGIPYHGRRLAPNTQICGVSILRAGEAFEPSLTAVCKDVRLGKILIQTNPETLEPELHYLRLPSDIKDCYVMLMDTTVASGAAAIMAMRVLVDHDVPEDHIILISLIMAIQGVHSVAYTYPNAHIVTSAIDPGLTDDYHILPGIGNFGDRYFGTSAMN
uniref:Uridine kinase n=1 Tax=Echinococcus granulosus TaxID=6210 RepID=A0A068WNV3_ECHGR|nr:uridine cytidine kinase 1 1 [Echinococcus granulosus]